jgi:hypothetical protein
LRIPFDVVLCMGGENAKRGSEEEILRILDAWVGVRQKDG